MEFEDGRVLALHVDDGRNLVYLVSEKGCIFSRPYRVPKEFMEIVSLFRKMETKR